MQKHKFKFLHTPRKNINFSFCTPYAKTCFRNFCRGGKKTLLLRSKKLLLHRAGNQGGGCGKPRTHLRALGAGLVAHPDAAPRATGLGFRKFGNCAAVAR